MEISRTLRSYASRAPAVPQEPGVTVDDAVVFRSSRGRLEIEPEITQDPDALALMEAFVAEYGQAMAKLAKW